MIPGEVAALLLSVGERIRHGADVTRGRLADTSARLAALADDAAERAESPVDDIDLAEAIERLRDALQRQDFSQLRQRDIRLALRKFAAFTVEDLAGCCETRPSACDFDSA